MFDFNQLTPKLLSVSELASYLRQLLESDEILQDIWIGGEISNFSQPRSGHLYFTLKDSQASIRCVMWKNQALRLRFLPQDGMLVEAHGSMSMYEAGGQVQLYIDTIRPAGEGALYQEFLRLRAKLEAEGLFEPDHKRPLPDMPKIIGVVTSATGAAYQDILNTLTRRFPLAKVVLSPATVQGVDAPRDIASALLRINTLIHPDVIILARGGGSIEDLWAFNSEEVARAIYNSVAPVISGVGHETDFTIADFVADLRAPTPTAAAELASPISTADLANDLQFLRNQMVDCVELDLREKNRSLQTFSHRLSRLSPTAYIANQAQRLDEANFRLERSITSWISTQKLHLSSFQKHLFSLNPIAVLQRGYAIVTSETDAKVISSVSQVKFNDRLNIHFKDGNIKASVQDIKQEDENA